ncbi:hypothetical protein D3C87_1671630 [compost metagenome]
MLAAEIRLLTSFIICAMPGSAPTSNTFLPSSANCGRSAASASAQPDAMIDSVPASAPRGPPLTGASTTCTPPDSSSRAIACSAPRPMVEVST